MSYNYLKRLNQSEVLKNLDELFKYLYWLKDTTLNASVVIEDQPRIRNPYDCVKLLNTNQTLQTCSQNRSNIYAYYQKKSFIQALELKANSLNYSNYFKFYRTQKYFCLPNDECPINFNDASTVYDGNHLSKSFVKYISKTQAIELGNLLRN
jgi:hypothetical protein